MRGGDGRAGDGLSAGGALGKRGGSGRLAEVETVAAKLAGGFRGRVAVQRHGRGQGRRAREARESEAADKIMVAKGVTLGRARGGVNGRFVRHLVLFSRPLIAGAFSLSWPAE